MSRLRVPGRRTGGVRSNVRVRIGEKLQRTLGRDSVPDFSQRLNRCLADARIGIVGQRGEVALNETDLIECPDCRAHPGWVVG